MSWVPAPNGQTTRSGSPFVAFTNTSVFFVNNTALIVDNFINKFFVKPDDPGGVMIHALVDQFTEYYRYHHSKLILYFRDRYRDSKIQMSTSHPDSGNCCRQSNDCTL